MSLVAHYPFNGNAEDLTGGHDGIPSNVSWVDGKVGQCASGGNIQVPHSDELNFRDNFAIAFWLRRTANVTAYSEPPIQKHPGTTSSNYRCYLFGADQRIQFYANRGGVWGSISGSFITPLNEWFHVALVYQNGGQLFINGSKVGGISGSGIVAINTTDISILTSKFDMDDLRLFNHALSEREVKDVANGLALHYRFNKKSSTENIAYTAAGNHDLTWSTLTASISVTDLIPNQKLKIESTTGGSFRVRFDHTRLIDGQSYNFSFKYSLVTGTSFTITDWCDTAFNNKVETDNSFSGWGVRSTYNSTYCFVDFNISANSVVHIYDIQLEQREFPTEFVSGSRDVVLSDSSGNGNDVVLTGVNSPQSLKESKTGLSCYQFYGRTQEAIIVNDAPHITGNQTIAMWLYPTDMTARRNPWNRAYGGEGTITQEINRTINYFYGTNGGNTTPYQGFNSLTPIPENQWTHIAIVRDLDAMTLTWYFNGEVVRTGAASYPSATLSTAPLIIGNGYTDPYVGRIDDVREYATALSSNDVKEIYRTGLAVDNLHRMHSNYLVESGIINPNILDYTTWTVGTTGSETGFGRNGSDAENHRVLDNDPFGKPVTVWEARPEATSGADGGWNGSYYPVDNTKLHRFSVWIRRTVIGNGSVYLGTGGGGSAVLNRSNGVSNSNPYFYSGGWGYDEGEWILIVGHVWPVGSGTGSSHVDSGRYKANGVKLVSATDFVCAAGTTSLRHRSYLFYSTNTTTRQQFVYPRMDVCDGTEPSIEALITGFDSINYDRIHDELNAGDVPDSLDVEYSKTKSGQFSEAGITRGLIAWYPLNGSPRDVTINRNDGSVVGAVVVDGANGRLAYSFDGVNDYIPIPYSSVFDTTKELTIAAWVNFDADSQSFIFEKGNVNTQYALFSHSTDIVFRTFHEGDGSYNTLNPSKASVGVVNGTWHFICAIFDGATKRIYVDGVERASVAKTGDLKTTTQGSSIGRQGGSSTGYYFTGDIQEVKIFSSALTAEEVAQEYESSSKSMINKSTAFAKEFIEV